MSTNKAQSSSKEQWWRRQVRQWRSSGLSVRAFCAAQGLSEPSFYAWRRTLAQREATAVPLVVQVHGGPNAPTLQADRAPDYAAQHAVGQMADDPAFQTGQAASIVSTP